MRPKTGHWMPMYWADYFADTTHFTAEEHGAYLLLIGTYWRRGFALPDDRSFLASTAKLTVRRFKTVTNNLSEKFIIVDGLWYHVRVEIELLKSCERIAKASASAHARWDAPAMLPTSTPKEESKKNLLNGFVVGGGGKKEMTPENKLAMFQSWLAKEMGSEGWRVVGHANDPSCPEYPEAVAFCRKFAKARGKGWPHQWPTL